jgi:hypothetical protein
MEAKQIRSIVLLGVVFVVGIALADWRDWISFPNLMSAGTAQVDRFTIVGRAPFCLLSKPTSVLAECHYLSTDQCVLSNMELFKPNIAPSDRALCVANPLGE